MAQWQEDPIEYIRKEFGMLAASAMYRICCACHSCTYGLCSDVNEEYYSPRKNVESFLYDLYKIRGGKHLFPMMQFISEIMIKYKASPSDLFAHTLGEAHCC
jgi:hypothetical protein